MGARRVAREHALMILFQIEVSRFTVETALERFFASFDDGQEMDIPSPVFAKVSEFTPPTAKIQAETRAYSSVLVRGVRHHLKDLDAAISAASSNWRVERMARVDRNLLRLGAFELLFMHENVPRKVALNEAVEVAKTFGTDDSSSFINGILDKIRPQ